jgi:hypothetical protein
VLAGLPLPGADKEKEGDPFSRRRTAPVSWTGDEEKGDDDDEAKKKKADEEKAKKAKEEEEKKKKAAAEESSKKKKVVSRTTIAVDDLPSLPLLASAGAASSLSTISSVPEEKSALGSVWDNVVMPPTPAEKLLSQLKRAHEAADFAIDFTATAPPRRGTGY